MVFFRSKQPEVFFFGNFHIDTQTVGIQPRLIHQLTTGSGNTLQMDITVETMDSTKVFGYTHQPFHRIIGIAHHSATQKKAFNIIAAVELHCQVHKFADGKSGTRQIITAAVNAISAIVYAIVCQHHLQQRNAPPVFCKAVADAPSAHSIAQHACLVGTYSATGRARDIVLCRLCQYLQLI